MPDFFVERLQKFLLMTVALTIVAALTAGLCRLLRLKPVPPEIARPKRSALCAVMAVSASMLVITVLMALTASNARPQPMTSGEVQINRRLLDFLAPQVILILIYCLPVALMLKLNRETLRSVGLTTPSFWKVAVVGLFLAALTLAGSGKGGHSWAHGGHGQYPLVAVLVYYGMVGFGEEFLFRGYLQTRLVAWLGSVRGWVIASLIMAVVHVPGRMFGHHMGLSHALADSMALVPISLFAGFVMLRTGSIIPSALFHTFSN